MPVIPEASGARISPIPEMSPSVAGAGFGALATSASQFAELGQFGGRVERAIAAAETHVKIMKGEISMKADKDDALLSFATDADYGSYPQKLNEIETTLRDKYNKQYEDDPKLAAVMMPHLDNHLREIRHAASLKGIQLLTDDTKGGLYTIGKQAAQEYNLEQDQTQKEIIKSKYFMDIDNAQGNHMITALDAAKRKQDFFKDQEESDIILKTRSGDPGAVEEGIRLLQEGKSYSHVEPEKKAAFLTAAESHLEKLNARLEKNFDKNATDLAVNSLDRTWTSPDGVKDFKSIYKQLDSADFRQANNLDYKRTEQVRTFFKGAETEYNASEKKAHDDEEKKVGQAFLKGKYGQAVALLSNPNTKLTGDELKSWKNAIDTKLKRTDDDISIPEDTKEYLRINRMMDQDVDPKTIEKEIIGSGHMKLSTRQRLLDRMDSDRDKTVKSGISNANKFLHSQIAPSKGAMMPAIPQEEANSAKAQQALSDWVKSENKSAVAGKRKPLSETEIFNKAVEMAPRYQMKIDEKIDLMVNNSQPGGKDVKGEVKPITTNSGKPAWLWPDGQYHYSAPPQGSK